ncbi:MAG: protein kinase [Planctomycetes bacterium]|nr:protein kinase [Planctomycetota bacterium]
MTRADEPTPPANLAQPDGDSSGSGSRKPSDPTVPLRLQPDHEGRFNLKRTQIPMSKPVALPTHDVEPIDVEPVAPAGQGPWLGTEATIIGAAPPAAAKPAEAAGEAWLGRDATMVPTDKAATPAQPWLGRDATMVGVSAPIPAGARPAEEWLGRESTQAGFAVDSANAKPGGKTPVPASLRKTTATMDDGWHLKGRQGPMTGQTMGDYEIGGILGEGGMGTVYRARQISLKRRVALKVLPPNLAHDQRLRERFEAEARTASLINSPHVVQVFAAGTVNDIVFFVMEFVEGTDLSDVIHAKQDAKQPFALEEAAGYVIQAARGLAEAGKHGIVHRDIKPPNLMITAKGVLKIADFGISKVAGEHSLTMTGTAVGTPAYVSPEQGRGDHVDQRSDIYSLGIVFYELITGQKPFDGATPNALIYQHNYTEPKLPKDLRADISDEYQAIVLKAMQKDPAKRYQEANELVADLERVRAGSAPMTALMSAFGTGADEAMKRLGIKQRKIWPLVAATVAVVLLIGGFVLYKVNQSETTKARNEEIVNRRNILVPLDSQVAVPQGADDHLKRLAELAGDDDTDVKRWRAKLDQVLLLQGKLGQALDAPGLPNAMVRKVTRKQLNDYKGHVGAKGQDVQRWEAKLAAAIAREDDLRSELAELDRDGRVVTADLAARLAPQLGELLGLVGEEDKDAKHWQARLAKVDERTAELRVRLAAMETANAVREAEIALLSGDLRQLVEIIGAADPKVVAWTARLKGAEENLKGLRSNLKRLDDGQWVAGPLQAELKSDLDEFAGLVEPTDADLKRWKARVATSAAWIADLRGKLSAYPADETLTVAQQRDFERLFTEFLPLVGGDDPGAQAFRARLDHDKGIVVAHHAVLVRLDKDLEAEKRDPLTEVDIAAAETALAQLHKLGAIADNRRLLHERRINEDKAYIQSLREDLKRREEANDFAISVELDARIATLARLVGEQDAQVKDWRKRTTEFTRVREALKVLDQRENIPEKSEQLLEDYVRIIGVANDEVRAWRSKVARVRELRAELESLDKVAPLPEGALENVAELTALIGERELQCRKWRKKVEVVIELVAILERDLERAYLLPEGVSKHARKLAELVGREDDRIASLLVRVAMLEGPGRPAWASDQGRDQYGLWTELTVKGVKQRFRYVPAGTFDIGSPQNEPGRDKDEGRVRMTRSRSYWIADTEVTQRYWEAIGGRNDSRFRGPERPVERVSWQESADAIARLNRSVPGLGARLPSEVEWEYACRVGVEGAYIGSDGRVDPSKVDTVAWYARNAAGGTKDVARRFPNPLGLFDMHGNVWEWCEDRYGQYSPTPAIDWIGREQETRVARGGSWGDDAYACRAANRVALRPELRTLYVGVRLAADVVWPDGFDPAAQLMPSNEPVAEETPAAP